MSIVDTIAGLVPRLNVRPQPLGPSLDAAAAWLARAQDAGDDDGVAAFYHLRRRQWGASYPETTGYIIPTLYAYAERRQSDEYFERATRMAAWESDIQFVDGGVMAGNLDAKTIAPTIFNTGQVLFGWAAAYEKTGNERFADSLNRAANWLADVQDDDGAWRRFASPFASHALNTYNTRVAFGLARASLLLRQPRLAQAAVANVEWALTQALPNGWFDNNDLEDNAKPLTHTIAYATRGILEVGALLDRPDFFERATRTAGAVAQTQRKNGALPGRLDSNWKAGARWSCLTGNAQMAIIWLRLARISGDRTWQEPASRCVAFNQATQMLVDPDPGRRGAIAGSDPVSGQYMRDRCPNWAAKFFMDAVMMLEEGEG